MKTDDVTNQELERRQMLGRVMRVGQILVEALSEESTSSEELRTAHANGCLRDNVATGTDVTLAKTTNRASG